MSKLMKDLHWKGMLLEKNMKDSNMPFEKVVSADNRAHNNNKKAQHRSLIHSRPERAVDTNRSVAG